MKESITKFDLEAAFKALDEIDVPKAEQGIRANKPALTEIFSRKSKFDALFEEYYDISNVDELSSAKDEREAEIAKAKLARIEKIVDLDADSPEDLQMSYVGKYIIQCPQCMTLFYKNQEDIEESEDDSSTVNVSEVCQHCGNDSGYTLIGKVGEVEEEVPADEEALETEDSELDLNIEDDEASKGEEESADGEESNQETDFDFDDELTALDLDDGEDSEDKKEESYYFINHTGAALVEELDDESPRLTESANLEVSPEEFGKLVQKLGTESDPTNAEILGYLNESDDLITEGGPGKLLKTLGKNIKNKVNKVSKSISTGIDKFADKSMRREEKAEWILEHAIKGTDKRFEVFIVIGYANTFINGKPIDSAPKPENNDLKVGMKYPEVKDNYKDADNVAKGWSMRQENGPARIYLAKSKNDPEAVYLCEYFKGDLVQRYDRLEEIFANVKNDLEGKDLEARGGLDQSNVKQVKASELKKGMVVVFEDETSGEVQEVGKSKLKADCISAKIKLSDDSIESLIVNADFEIQVQRDSIKNESMGKQGNSSLESVVSTLEELHEASLEHQIANSLITAYGNVAGFKLQNCSYLKEQLNLDGIIYFTSGNTRKTTYTFTEALSDKTGKINLTGSNKKLGLDKQFTITGRVDKKSKTFITESFNQKIKK